MYFTLLGHIASVNNVVVTVLYLLREPHRRISVSYIVKNPKLRRPIKASLSTAIYGNKMCHCLLSRLQRSRTDRYVPVE